MNLTDEVWGCIEKLVEKTRKAGFTIFEVKKILIDSFGKKSLVYGQVWSSYAPLFLSVMIDNDWGKYNETSQMIYLNTDNKDILNLIAKYQSKKKVGEEDGTGTGTS